jgi:hypothetical protein
VQGTHKKIEFLLGDVLLITWPLKRINGVEPLKRIALVASVVVMRKVATTPRWRAQKGERSDSR